MLRFLVLDAYPKEDRDALRSIGGKLGGERYVEVLRHLEPDCSTDLIYPADANDPLPEGVALVDYDGIVWSGSTLTVHEDWDERVRRTIAFAQAGFEAGVPSYGSCYAAQVAVVAAGGTCIRNPRGRELGAVHDIELTDLGRRHELFGERRAGDAFSVFQSHQDIIDALPPGAEVLATNAKSPVQAVAVRHRAGMFWPCSTTPSGPTTRSPTSSRCATRRSFRRGSSQASRRLVRRFATFADWLRPRPRLWARRRMLLRSSWTSTCASRRHVPGSKPV